MIRKLTLLGAAVLAVLVVTTRLVASSVEAGADTTGRLQSPIAAGSDNQVIGTATMEWVLADDGAQTANFTVDLTTTGVAYPVDHMFVCLSTEAFSSRTNPAKCEMPPKGVQLDPGGAPTASVSIPLGVRVPRPPEGPPLCAQVHVDTRLGSSDRGSTAFAGWEDGKPFYGNLCFPASHLPTGAIGLLALAAVIGIAFVVAQRRRRTPSPVPVG